MPLPYTSVVICCYNTLPLTTAAAATFVVRDAVLACAFVCVKNLRVLLVLK